MNTDARGWKHVIQRKDGFNSWILLKNLKESYLIEVHVYEMTRCIYNYPAYVWWVPYTLRKRNIIISIIHHRIRKTTHKYGIKIPSNIEHAYDLDEINGKSF